MKFESGRAVHFDAEHNGDVLARYAQRDEGACRLGEVALVDGEGRIGPLDTVFFDTLLDENAASHIALGSAYKFTVDDEADQARANDSEIHVDFMIGSRRREGHRRHEGRRPRPRPRRRPLAVVGLRALATLRHRSQERCRSG